MPEVPAILTPLEAQEARDVLIGGHLSAVGELPGYNRLAVAWAQVMLETAHGQSCWNYNLGNIKCASPTCQANYPWCLLPLPSGSPEYPIQRAYVGPVEGAAGYWRLIGGERYAPALPLFDAGQPYEAMMALGELGYFTAPPTAYAQTVSALFAEFVSRWPHNQFDPGGQPVATESHDLRNALLAAALVVGAGAAYWHLR